eukprot:XP_011538502.1 cilia- and flagella-associated protein 43 isoform X9 [Homo sapiens]
MAQGRERDEGPHSAGGASLSVRWVQGFPKQNVHFVNDNTICYPCGNYVIFINIETKKKTVLQCSNGIVGVMATNIPCEVVAFSDRKLKPLIYVYSFPGLTRRTKLKGNILLDYTLLSFSYCGTYLASYSSLPEFELALWNWESSIILCKKSQPGMDVNQMSFNPMNWRQLCLSSPSTVSVWTIERSNQEHCFRARSVKLPLEDGSFFNETDVVFPQSLPKDLIYGPVLPLSAIAGLVGKEAETFRPKDDLYPLLHPTMHCWTPTSDLYIGCEEGHLLMINGDTLQVTVLNKIEEESPLEDRRNFISPVTLVYQKEGVLASGIDGFVYSFIIKDRSYMIEDFLEIERPVEHMTFSPNYTVLLIQTDKGSVYIYTFGKEPTLNKVLDACDGKFQAIDFITPGTQYFMTLTYSGEICVWWLEDCACVSKIYLNTLATVLACCPSSLSAAVGTEDGSVYFISVYDKESPQVVHKAFLSESSVQHVVYDQQGIFLLVGTAEGKVFIINANSSSSFQIIGFTEVAKDILQISTVSLLETDIVEVMVLSSLPEAGRSRLEMFTLPTLLPQVSTTFADERGRLKDEIIHKYLYELEHALSSAVLGFQSNQIYGFCSQVPYICSYLLPEEEHTGIYILKPYKKVQSRQYGPGLLYLSSHGLWLITIAKCGILCIRDVYTLETFAWCRSHSHQGHGIQSMRISMDGQNILVNGRDDGTLVYLKWKRFGGHLASEILDYYQKLLISLSSAMDKENHYLSTTPKVSVDLGSDSEHTVIRRIRSRDIAQEAKAEVQVAMMEVEESCAKERSGGFQKQKASTDLSQDELVLTDVKKEIPWIQQKSQEAIKKEVNLFSKKRKEIKQGIKSLSKTILNMMEENDKLENIAKLDQQEFGLDLEELERLHDESQEEVAKMIKDVEMHNLAKSYLAELIKEECWNSMAVKGRALKCFHIPCVVENFPMKARTVEELKELERVLQQKKIEAECLKLRKEIVEAQSGVKLIKQRHEEDDEEEEEEDKTVKYSNLPNYLLGSLSTDFGVDTSLLSSQLELHSREEKINQIILLKDIIYKVKTVFNNEFDAAYKQKEFEIARVKERNVRIREIILDLELEEAVWQPEFEDCEKPERTLVVQDEEITAHKHIKPWHKAKELIVNHEKEHWLLIQDASTRLRALMDMMGGVLEVKKEDILRMVIPQPAFMAKPDAVWTEEERKQFKDYEKKVKELNEERDKYRKSLEAELKKLQNSIQESTQAFDEHLKRLFERRVKAEMVTNQVKQKAADLLEMATFLQKRVEEEEKVQQEIERVFHELILLQEEKVRFQLNLTIQILLKQGQVELENFQLVLEYSDAILINKNIIEDLNSVIRTQGQKKVASMMESKDVHKRILQIEWEHKKMEMEREDLNQKAWDIQMLFFSRDRQKYLNEPNYEALISIQIGIMEQTIAVLDKMHKKNVENCKKLLKKLGKFSNQKDIANYALSCNLREELVAVSERKDICNAMGSKLTCEKIVKERYENMMQQQKLTNISKQQAEQISILQTEVERLRMKTFPALVQM